MYGGFFIFLSYAWGWAVDKEKPDTGGIRLCLLQEDQLLPHYPWCCQMTWTHCCLHR